MKNIERAAEFVLLMDKQLKNQLFVVNGEVQGKKLWENTFIKHQLDKRDAGDKFSVGDHIRAMVYSLLSFGAQWSRLEPYIDINTGEISAIDDLFCQYDTEKLLSCDPEEISDKILSYKLGSPYTKKQMNALITENVSKLLSLERQYGSIDSFYMKILVKDETQKTLVKELSSPKSPHKFIQFGEALITEYLKNVGYDIAKPDRHIRRILGRNILDCSEHENAPAYEAIDIVAAIARQLNRPAAEVDYILWAYCAKNYGEICTKNNPHCDRCYKN